MLIYTSLLSLVATVLLKEFSLLSSSCFLISYSLLHLVSRPITLPKPNWCYHQYSSYLLCSLSSLWHCWLFHPFETHASLNLLWCSAFPPTSLVAPSLSSMMSTPLYAAMKYWDSLRLKHRPSSFSIYLPWAVSSKTTTPITNYRPNVYIQLRLPLWALKTHIFKSISLIAYMTFSYESA